MKRCSRCGRDLPVEAFSKDRSTATGLQHRCKECTRAVYLERRAKCQAYAQEHAERIAAYQAEYRNQNRERLAQMRRTYYAENAERLRSYARERYARLKGTKS